MPPINQSERITNPEGSTPTWNPRLVKTPVPIMLATTIAVAVNRDTPGGL